MSTDAFEIEIEKLKAVVGAKSDSDLARELGLSRYAVAKWRKKGAIPPAYDLLFLTPGLSPVDAAVLFIIRREIYGNPAKSYFLRMALQALSCANLDPADNSIDGEIILTRLMGMASDVCRKTLGKPLCESEEEYGKLVAAMFSDEEEERLVRTLRTFGYETPQSDSAISG